MAGTPQPIMKPNIVFFGESLAADFFDAIEIDADACDLILVMGSSLQVPIYCPSGSPLMLICVSDFCPQNQVSPVARIPSFAPDKVPQILLNRESLRSHEFNAELLGLCDVVVGELAAQLGWDLPARQRAAVLDLSRAASDQGPEPTGPPSISRREGRTCFYAFHEPNRFVFTGAVLGSSYSDEEDCCDGGGLDGDGHTCEGSHNSSYDGGHDDDGCDI